MSALTDRIAAEHQPESGEWSVCICGQADLRYGRAWDRHIATITEAAVREQVAQDIEATYLGPDFGRNPATGQDSPHAMHAEAYDEGLYDAARIARGEQ